MILILLKMLVFPVLVFCLISTPAFAATTSINIGIYQNRPKIYIDEIGDPAGFFPDIVKHIAGQEGWTTRYIPCNWNECLEKLERGEIDLMPDVAYSESRAGRFDFSGEVVLSSWSRVYAKEDDDLNSILDLNGKRIAVLKGSYQADRLLEEAKAYSIHPLIVEADSFSLLFELIENKSVDAVILNRFIGALYKGNYDIHETSIVFFPVKLHFAVPKGKNAELLALIDRHMRGLKADKGSVYYSAMEKALAPAMKDEKPLVQAGAKERRAILRKLVQVPASSIELTKEERLWLKEHPVLRLGYDTGRPPVEFLDEEGHFQGMSADYMERIEKLLGIKFEPVKPQGWQETLEAARAGELDILSAVKRTPQKEEFLTFTRPYLSFPIVIVTTEKMPYIGNMAQLKDRRVAVVSGFATHDILMNNHPDYELQVVEDVKSGLMAVVRGHCDAFIGNMASISHVIGREGLTGLKVSGETPYRYDMAIGIPKDRPLLASIMQKALDAIGEEERSAIHRKWLSVTFEQRVDYTLLLKQAAGFVLVIALILFWTRHIFRQKKTIKLAKEAADEANRDLEAFSYSVSHDLRAPLRAIDGFSRILLDDYSDKLDAEGRRLLNIVRDNTDKMSRLIEDILQFSRIGRKEIDMAEIDMNELAAAVFKELKASEPDKKLKFKAGKLPAAYGDESMIRQVFVNLISNAIKFTRKREVAIIELSARLEGSENIYCIQDNGVGFDMEYKDKLFGVFQRLHGQEEFEGTGAGLAIVKRIVEKHGGRVWAEGKAGEGATFWFSLPNKRRLPLAKAQRPQR